MSDQPPENGWSLPPQDDRYAPFAQPPHGPPPVTLPARPPGPFSPPTSTPIGPPTTGFGEPPGHYVPGPLTASQFDAIIPDPIPEPPPIWKRWWFVLAMVVVLGGGGALIWANSRNDAATETIDDTRATRDTRDTRDTAETTETVPDNTSVVIPDITLVSIPEFTIPSLPPLPTVPGDIPPVEPPVEPPVVPPLPPGETDAVPVGTLVTLGDGTAIRVNSVTAHAPPTQTVFTNEEGTDLTRIEFEACAGSDGFASANPLFWVARLPDGTEASVFLFSFDIITAQIAPGGCVRGLFDFEVPLGETIAVVAMRNAFFQEAAFWDPTSSVEFDGALIATSPVAAIAVGQTVSLADGGSATLRSVLPNSEPLDEFFPAEPGRQFVRLDVEVCAGSVAVSVGPQNFFGVAVDSQVGTSSFFGATFESSDIAPGQCRSGLIDLDMPADIAFSDVFVTGSDLAELGRWRV